MLQRIFIFLFVLNSLSSAAQHTAEQAESYYEKGAFNKALIIYESLAKQYPNSYNYRIKLIDIHQQLEQYDKSETIIRSILERRYNPMIEIMLGYNFQLQDRKDRANAHYENAIAFTDEHPNYIYSIARKFEEYALLERAIQVYEKAKVLTPQKDYSIQLAKIYGDLGNVEQMFSNYITYIAYAPSHINSIKRAISDFISENSENENNRYLRRQLLIHIQQEPSTYWYEMLSWLYIQEKAYQKAFIQEKALYKRQPESLYRIIELANLAHTDHDDATAKTIYNFILDVTQNLGAVLSAHQALLEIDTKTADLQQLEVIDENYKGLFKTYGKNERTLDLQLAYGKFLAFHKKDPNAATTFLKQSLTLNLTKFEEAEIKLLLADILVLQEKFNEALIFYSQIQLNLKNSPIAQEARFKVAKTSYYKGDFDWAESQLKVLKSSTSQLIANDALDLKLLISDNKYEDSTQTALKSYAKADLLAFQNKPKAAISLLDQLLKAHQGESITDQALFKQAQLFEQTKQFDKAEANYLQLIKDYRDEILADDAHYHLAELYRNALDQPEKAKDYYEIILFKYQDSIYFVEARRRFRMLRGDFIN